ncbi:MAG: thioredoxin domain-containing protein [Candidatus Magasanikbacteria bacterium]|nr:thioredoxin domain-containing protein [Candidatus Magasanikbacteria bacterium]
MKETDQNLFEEILRNNQKPIVVVCYMSEKICPLSIEMVKMVADVSEKRQDFDFYSLNALGNIDYTDAFSINDVPTTNIFFKGRDEVKIEGLILQTKFIQKLDEFLAGIKK